MGVWAEKTQLQGWILETVWLFFRGFYCCFLRREVHIKSQAASMESLK